MKNFKVVVLVAVAMLFLFSSSVKLQAGAEPNNYILIFQANEYNSKVGDALDFFFKKGLKGPDQVTLLSPMRPYSFSRKTRQNIPAAKLANRVKDVMKKDISLNAAGYISNQAGMNTIVQNLSEVLGTNQGSGMTSQPSSGSDIKNLLIQYKKIIQHHRSIRKISTGMLLKLTGILKPLKGKKNIIYVYQQTHRIVPDKDTMDALRENPEVSFLASEAFFEENTRDILDTGKIIAALKDAGVTLHFVYVKTLPRRKQRIAYKELSGDVYGAISKIAKGCGGEIITTSKPEAAFKKLTK